MPTYMLAGRRETEVCYANPWEGPNPVLKMQGLSRPDNARIFPSREKFEKHMQA